MKPPFAEETKICQTGYGSLTNMDPDELILKYFKMFFSETENLRTVKLGKMNWVVKASKSAQMTMG